MTRFYLSSAGYIVDRQTDTQVARIKDREGWRLRGERMCSALELNPGDIQTMLDLWADDLESANFAFPARLTHRRRLSHSNT